MTSLIFRLAPLMLAVAMQTPAVEPGFTPLFNGKDFTGWKLSNAPSFTIEDGAIVAKAVGMQGHAFYDGPFMDHSFRNFELKVDVMTRQNSNGGVFILTEFVEKGWPSKGFEIQVNNSYMKDPRKTGKPLQHLGRHGNVGQRRRVVHRAHHRAGRHHHDQGATTSRSCSGRYRRKGALTLASVRSRRARSRSRRTTRTAPFTTGTSGSSR